MGIVRALREEVALIRPVALPIPAFMALFLVHAKTRCSLFSFVFSSLDDTSEPVDMATTTTTSTGARAGADAGSNALLLTLEEQILQLADHEAWLDAQIRELEFANSHGNRNALSLLL